MDNKELRKVFTRYLKDNGLFASFVKNFTKQTKVRRDWCESSDKSAFSVKKADGFIEYVENINDKKGIISWAFKWADSPEGHDFWSDKSSKWEYFYEKLT
jgi:hypothetical protein